MPKVLTDEKLIDKFLNRGVEKIFPTKEALKKKLMSGDQIRVYQGFDPTGPYLHVGHAIGIRALRILQQLGHEVIFLIGDYTAKVGDPDKDKTRKILTDEEIEKNREGWKEQASQLIDFEGENPVLFKRNYEWLSKLSLEDLIKLMSQTTVQQMIEREMFDKRLKEQNPIGLHELIYPLMQGFDSVAMKVDMEIGGTDQTFNMLMGRQLVKSYLGKEKYVRTNIMMEAPDALTMSKTRGNGINLSDTPEDMYGKAMSYPDDLIKKGFELLTDLALEEIKEMEIDEDPMKFKKKMAFEIVRTIKGDSDAQKAQQFFEKTVQRKETPIEEAIPSPAPKEETTLYTFLKENKAIDKSGGEIKRMIEQGGVEVNDVRIKNPMATIEFKKGDIIKFGKRTFIKVE